MRLVISIHRTSLACLLSMVIHAVLAGDLLNDGPFTDKECVNCHVEREPELIQQWRTGAHGPESGLVCSSCHGDRHRGSAEKARQNNTCSSCHQGSASHSYATSKHGVIVILESTEQNWKKPLKTGSYRAPGCSYCHLHDGDHDDTMTTDRGPELRHWVCSGCHGPRYVREQFANAKRQLEIADLKLAEGEELIGDVDNGQNEMLLKLRKRLIHHRKNVLYGVGHQSPDYQWWLGQPALDGDLIRIRDAINKLNH
ncbi:MAG: hypothetical protein GY703_12565 [Gammaproteobacteria bacterium]|nr:hypothetical protein [Gammaproteobacteria bacterium]